MPLRLPNVAQTFQRFVDQALRGLSGCYSYVADILVASYDGMQHLHHLRQLLARLREHKVQVNREKCVFGVTSLTFLGHQATTDGTCPFAREDERCK